MDLLSLDSRVHAVLEAGIAAPSADNHHCFKFECPSRYVIRLWGTPEYWRSEFQRRTLQIISLGAVVENMRLRAEAVGFHLSYVSDFDGSKLAPVVTIQLSDGSSSASPLERFIESRTTNRSLRFRKDRLTEVRQAELMQVIAPTGNDAVVWLDSPGARRKAIELIWRAESERFHTKELHRELFSSIRFDIGWKDVCAVGLPPGSLGVERLLRAPFQLLSHWPVMRVANAVGGHRIMGFRAGWLPAYLSAHLVAFGSRDPSFVGSFESGKLMQRAWLALASVGMAVQPLAAAPLFALKDNVLIDTKLRSLLRSGWRSLLGPDIIPRMLFRMGWAPAPAFRASRASLPKLFLERSESSDGSGCA